MRHILRILFITINIMMFSCSTSKKEYNNDYIIMAPAEEEASFPGGEAALMEFIANNIKYPQEALDNNIEGKVFTTFIVETNGEIRDINIMKGLGYGLDEEAIRIIKLMPKWKPTIQIKSKTKLRQQFVLPIRFKLP